MMLGFVAALTDTAVQMNLCYELGLKFAKKYRLRVQFLVVYYTCMISCIEGFVNIYLKVIRKKIEQKISLCAETQRETVYNALILEQDRIRE